MAGVEDAADTPGIVPRLAAVGGYWWHLYIYQALPFWVNGCWWLFEDFLRTGCGPGATLAAIRLRLSGALWHQLE